MAGDNLNQVGKYIKKTGQTSDAAIKRTRAILPKRDRVRDTVSSVFPFKMTYMSEGKSVLMDIDLNKPPPSTCTAGCLSAACEQFTLEEGGHSITLTNPYEIDTVTVWSQGDELEAAQWYEESPEAGQVYVQVQGAIAFIIVCYTYISC